MKRTLLNWTPEIIEFIKARADMPRHELAEAINSKFNTSFSYEQVRGFCKRNGILTGRTGRFYKGQARPPGSGAKEANATSFKKGDKPHNALPVGSTRFTTEGYWQTKVYDTGYTPYDWVETHRIIWEEHNGPIPENHLVIFVDLDTNNLDINNLRCVSRSENAVIIRRNLRRVHPEYRHAAITLGQLITKTTKVAKS